MITFLHIVLDGAPVEVRPSSVDLGYLVTANPGPHACRGCGEDLTYGPCRRGAAECYACGCRHELVGPAQESLELDVLLADGVAMPARGDGPVMPGTTSDTPWTDVQAWMGRRN